MPVPSERIRGRRPFPPRRTPCRVPAPRWVRQASLNFKAETVDDLQGRRKRLFEDLCKLVLEDLSLQAEDALAAAKARLERLIAGAEGADGGEGARPEVCARAKGAASACARRTAQSRIAACTSAA